MGGEELKSEKMLLNLFKYRRTRDLNQFGLHFEYFEVGLNLTIGGIKGIIRT